MPAGGRRPSDLRALLARFARARVIVPLALLLWLALILSVAAVLFAGKRQDDLQELAERNAIAHAVRQLGRSLAAEVKDYGWWDEALQHLAAPLDAEWADRNVGPFVFENFGYEVSLVVAGDGRIVYGQVDGGRDAAAAAARLGPRLPDLVREALANVGTADGSSVWSTLTDPDGQIYVVAATAVLPSAGPAALPRSAPPAVLVFAKRLDAAFLAGLADDLAIAGARLSAWNEPGLASYALPGLGGSSPGFVLWRPKRAGWFEPLLLLPALAGAFLFSVFAALLIVARDRVDRVIRESEARFQDISEVASDWIWECDREQRLTFVSGSCRRSLGRAPEELLGRALPALLQPDPIGTGAAADIAALAADGPFQGAVFRCPGGDGQPRVLRLAGKVMRDDGTVLGYRGIATDITAEVAALEQARFLALHDGLTGLPNRALMAERLTAMLARCRRRGGGAAVLCLDLDGFKEINDTLGHAVGDRLLVQCAERLRGCLRDSDSVARLGGDEFTILQDEVAGPADVECLCRRIVTVLAQPFDLEGRKARISVSIGVALVPEDGEDPVRLLQRADMALYRAKNGGRNRHCFFEPGMDRQLQRRRQAESDLRRALGRGEFLIRYQPLIACATGAVVGVEALVRWAHPVRGTLLPVEFLPLAEETGLINRLGEHILTTACRDAAQWDGITVAVNVSATQFRQRDFAGTVAAALAATALPPHRLELEVTEGLLLHDDGAALAMLGELKALGVRITMDDFGTGYSSLAQLQRFPFDKIKIDRSFVRQLDARPNTRGIVRAIIQLGQSLAVPICAEGVETPAQLHQLRDEGCEEAQGFLFAHPVAAAEVPELLAGRGRYPASRAAVRGVA